VSISKRLFDFARSELNSLLDRASELGDRSDDADAEADAVEDVGAPGPTAAPPPRRSGRKVRLEDLSDEELEAEIERRRLDKELDERAEEAARRASSGARRTRPTPTSSAKSGSSADPIAKAYAALEVPNGSDFETVRKAYRTLMRKYHPDRHTATPDKQKAANELAQKLTDAYKTLERRLRPPTTP
jgi:DnaJ-domain-containing protein 1